MLKLSIEELSTLNLVLKFISVPELLDAAMKGFVTNENPSFNDEEKSDLCWKALQSLK